MTGAKTAHQVHTPEIDLDEDGAKVVWAAHIRTVFDNGTSVTGYGHYIERWVRQAHEWKLASLLLRHLIIDVHRADP